MAYLSWQNEPVEIRLDYEPSGIGAKPSRLEIQAPKTLRAELFEAIQQIRSGERSELRLDLPQGYSVFVKLKDSGLSRLLIAHPEENEWVATFMLSPEVADAWIQSEAPGVFSFASDGRRLDRMGNLEAAWAFFGEK